MKNISFPLPMITLLYRPLWLKTLARQLLIRPPRHHDLHRHPPVFCLLPLIHLPYQNHIPRAHYHLRHHLLHPHPHRRRRRVHLLRLHLIRLRQILLNWKIFLFNFDLSGNLFKFTINNLFSNEYLQFFFKCPL